MSPPPRSLTFVVSTSLLTASLSLAGCDDPKEAVNPGPVEGANKGGDEDTVNVGPEKPPDTKEVNPGPEPEPPPLEPIHVNEGPEPKPEPVIRRGNLSPVKAPPEPVEPTVNTRPEP
jgi:hypothetical protein